jgi:hypothetical protein
MKTIVVNLIIGPDPLAPAYEGFEPELPDFEPTEEDARWWAEETAWLESQRPHVGPLSLPEHDARLEHARRMAEGGAR